MSDQNFHEIQLSGKQLVFLFMCAVVLTVVVFLFGVSVGRQVPPASLEADAGAASSSTDADAVAGAAPAAPAAAPGNEISYADALEAPVEDPTKAAPPAPVPEEATTSVQVAEATPPPAPAKSSAEPTPAAKAAPKAAPAAAVATGITNGWFVQVGAFNANDVAGREVTKLKGRGYPASVLTEPPTVPGPRFKVRVGPYERPEADRVRAQLSKEGYPSFLRR
jgi:cell division septation protein DedD